MQQLTQVTQQIRDRTTAGYSKQTPHFTDEEVKVQEEREFPGVCAAQGSHSHGIWGEMCE